MVVLPKGNLLNPSRFLASTSPRCGSRARLLRSLRDFPPSFALRRMCPVSSQRAGFKCASWLKIPRQNLTSQTIIKCRIYPILYHFSPMKTGPQAIKRSDRGRLASRRTRARLRGSRQGTSRPCRSRRTSSADSRGGRSASTPRMRATAPTRST